MLKCITASCPVPSSSFKYVEEKLLKGLEDYLQDLILDEKRLKEKTEAKQPDNPYPKMITEAEKELKELEKQVDSLDNLLEQGVYTIEKYTVRSGKLNEVTSKQKKTVKQLIAANEQFIEQTENIPKRIKTITRVIECYKMTDDITIKNKLLKEIMIKAVYNREPNTLKGDFKLEINLLKL